MALQIVTADSKSGTQGTNATTWTLTWPTNLAAGDQIIAIVSADSNPTITWPAELTQFAGVASGTTVSLRVASGIATGTETGTFDITLSASEQGNWWVLRITGNDDATAPERTTANDGLVASVNPDAPSLTPTWGSAENLWIAIASVDNGNTAVTVDPTNYTALADLAGGATGTLLAVAHRLLTAATDDPSAWTIDTSRRWCTATIVVRPEAAGGSDTDLLFRVPPRIYTRF